MQRPWHHGGRRAHRGHGHHGPAQPRRLGRPELRGVPRPGAEGRAHGRQAGRPRARGGQPPALCPARRGHRPSRTRPPTRAVGRPWVSTDFDTAGATTSPLAAARALACRRCSRPRPSRRTSGVSPEPSGVPCSRRSSSSATRPASRYEAGARASFVEALAALRAGRPADAALVAECEPQVADAQHLQSEPRDLTSEVRLLPTNGAEAGDLLATSEGRQPKPPHDATPAQRCACRASGLLALTTLGAATPTQSRAL